MSERQSGIPAASRLLVRVAPDAERPADARSPLVDLTRCVAWIVKPVEHSLFGPVGEARLLRTPGGVWITHFANHAIGGRDRTYSTPDDELVGWWLANPGIEPPADVAAMLAGMDATARPPRAPFRPFRRVWAFLSGRLMGKDRNQAAEPEPTAVVASEAPATVGPASDPEPEPTTPEAPTTLADVVTLDQMAAAVHRKKRTLERRKTDGKLPPPLVEGGGGKPDLWDWKSIRDWLTKEFGVPLPERFPGNVR